MLYNEFIERTGLQVTEAEFQHIESIYMSCDNIDNPTFCKNYAAVHENPIVEGLFSKIRELEKHVDLVNIQFAHMRNAYCEMRRNLGDDAMARRLAVKAYEDEGKYIVDMLNEGMYLNEDDKVYIINNL